MTNQEISELIALFDRSSASELKLSQEGFTLELRRAEGRSAAPAVTEPTAAEPVPAAEGALLRSPLVGTYYAAPSPGKSPFVQPGDRVAKGQTVCMIEAMKMMSEVAAPCDCVIEEALQENGALLAYDTPIFRYREV
jgi:biotin carboxyl carrier protein